MAEPPLLVPLLLRPSRPAADSAIPLSSPPTHLASWQISTPAGPSRLTCLASSDNSLWLHTSSPSFKHVPPPSNAAGVPAATSPRSPITPSLPTIAFPSSSSGSSSPRIPRPQHSRRTSYNRPRTPSSASSILTAHSATHAHGRISAFSPPPTARQLPTTSLASATARPATPDVHAHRASLSEKAELRDALRDQGVAGKDERVGLGLGMGMGKRVDVKGRGEEAAERSSLSGNMSPSLSETGRTERSLESGRTLQSRLFGWAGAGSGKDEEAEADAGKLEERLEEEKAEREVKREEREVEREEAQRKVVEDAIDVVQARDREEDTRGSERIRVDELAHGQGDGRVRRLVLRRPDVGQVVRVKVLEAVGVIAVLRDVGLLDIFDLTTMSPRASFDLEDPGDPSSPTSRKAKQHRLAPFWFWRDVHLAHGGEKQDLLVVSGPPWPCAMPSPNGEVTRVVMLSAATNAQTKWQVAAKLELAGEGGIEVVNNEDGSSYILHNTPTSFTSYPITFPTQSPSYPSPRSTATPQPQAQPQSRSVSSILPPSLRPSTPSPQPSASHLAEPHEVRKSRSFVNVRDAAAQGDHAQGFAKFLAGRRGRQEDKDEEERRDREKDGAGVGEGKEVERDGGGGWKGFAVQPDGMGAGWEEDGVDVFECNGKTLQIRGRLALDGRGGEVNEVVFAQQGKVVAVLLSDEVRILEQQDVLSPGGSRKVFTETASLRASAMTCRSGSSVLLVSTASAVSEVDLSQAKCAPRQVLLFRKSQESEEFASLVPLDLETLFVADPQGNIRKRSLAAVLGASTADGDSHMSADRLDSPATIMRVVSSRLGKFLIAGDEDGVVRIWTAESFELQGSFTVFADPVSCISLVDAPQAGPLRDTVLCASIDGTVGVISLSDMELTFLLPASRAPLRRIFVGSGKDILLAYANGKARVWNVETCEFRRSTGLDAGEEMIQSGDWAEIPLHDSADTSLIAACSSRASDLSRMLLLDMRQVGNVIKQRDGSLEPLKPLLAAFLTYGMDRAEDEVCETKLGIQRPVRAPLVGTISPEGMSDLGFDEGEAVWRVSAAQTGLRQLVIVSLLRPFLDSPEYEPWAAKIIAFYTASLPVGTVEPDLEFFADYYLDSSAEVYQAARMLFGARLDRMSESEIEAVVNASQKGLPISQPPAERLSAKAARALTMIGGMALHKYQSMSPSSLKAVSDSLVLYLEPPSASSPNPHLPLAIHLVSQGFPTWQSYVDPMDLLRRLFLLSTHSAKSSYSAPARLAVLHVAATLPALFMSTLSMDILDARSLEGRTSIMKLCVYMARRNPQVLEGSLPRVAEAVVKSLDPNVGKMRDEVWETATVILNELVQAFSTIDFHSGTQRLAVGTHEGAVIMYDLKTASRLYVLEPHKSPVSAVVFSPDGRRLLTVSLDEGDVTVWKVGSSLSGFFNVGGPPRQGVEKGEPFKRIVFMRADDEPMGSTSALSEVKVEWPGPRKAKVQIRETALTFET